MTESQSQQTRKPSEATDTVRFFVKGPGQKEPQNQEPKEASSADTSKPKKATGDKVPTAGAQSTPRVKDRSSIPREQMSGHRVGTDIPIRLDKEILHRKENGIKMTLANLTDDILNIGLEFYEKRRNKLEEKKSVNA